MIISIASGKGGTGKTSLALMLAAARDNITVMDCDVEEPNCHLFLQPAWQTEETVAVKIPVFDPAACDGCGRCSEVCLFNALAITAGKPLLFPELCHSCGGCLLACPRGAVGEEDKPVGSIRTGPAKASTTGTKLISGLLQVGLPAAGPLIKALKERLPENGDIVIDSPPGTSCSMAAATAGSDYAVLVTEPTPFGLHDLELAWGVARLLGIPAGVVINKSDSGAGDALISEWCAANSAALLAAIPHSRAFAAAYSEGTIPAEYRDMARQIWDTLTRQVTGG